MCDNLKSLFFTSLYNIMYCLTLIHHSCMNLSIKMYNTSLGQTIYSNVNSAKYILCHDWFQRPMENPNNYCGIFRIVPQYNEWFDENTFITEYINNMTQDTNKVLDMLKSMRKDKNDLIILKSQDFKLYRLASSTTGIGDDLDFVKNMFLTIEYTHKKMEDKIEILLHKSDLLMNNEILSYAFIYKYLLYNHSDFVIDDEYVIYIIDKDLNTIDINHEKYVILKDNGYEIACV